MRNQSRLVIAIAVAIVIVVAVFAVSHLPSQPSSATNQPPTSPQPSACPHAVGLCVERNVTRVIDGDTLDVAGNLRIRLVLVDAPELNATGGQAAQDRLTSLCLGKQAPAHQDDKQTAEAPYGRVLA